MNRIKLLRGWVPRLLLLVAPMAVAQTPVTQMVDEVEAQVITWRRHIHEHPELSFQEHQTAAYIAQALRALPGFEVRTGVGQTGVKAVLRGGRPGPVLALRADMDALPIEERNDLPFRSKAKAMWQGKESSVMHACGHDAHVAMLLGAATVLSKMREELPGSIVLLFQPAEEWGGGATPSGAFAMVADGALDNPRVDAVLGQHIASVAPAGQVSYRFGSLMASSDNFRIVVKGVGGHAGLPWMGKDPILAASHIVTQLQSIVSREVDLSEGAASVSVAQFNAGNRPNITPESATLAGTIRTLSEATRLRVHQSLTRVAQRVAEAAGVTAEVSIDRGYPVLSNNSQLGAKVLAAIGAVVGESQVKEVPPTLGSEDFGAFTDKVPGFYWALNAPPPGGRPAPPNHSPLFMLDEQYLKVGVKVWVQVALAYLANAPR